MVLMAGVMENHERAENLRTLHNDLIVREMQGPNGD